MTVSVADFRVNFPAFADPAVYPDAEITFWLGLAALLNNPARWGDVYDYAIQLFVAHNLSLEFNAKKASQSGQNPGGVVGNLSSATVDKVSYTRDTASVMDPANGHWNLTIYGLRYIRLLMQFGAGPIQVGTPGPNDFAALAWPGPYPYPNPSD